MQHLPFDNSNMRQVLIDFPKQFLFSPEIKEFTGVKNIVLAGMGGSAWATKLLNCIVGSEAISVHDDYGLPPGVTKDTLVLACSYSGNTEETLNALENAEKKTKKIIAIASGGLLEQKAAEKGFEFIKIPKVLQPRFAGGYFTASQLKVLFQQGFSKDYSSELLATSKFLEKNKKRLEEQGKALAEETADHIPILYSSKQFVSVARVAKIKFNENAKTPAFFNEFPELNHTETPGFSNSPASFHFFLLKNEEDNSRVKKRMTITKQLFEERGHKVTNIEMIGESRMQQVFSTSYLFDWASFYLALHYGQDPTPVDIIESLKKKLSE